MIDDEPNFDVNAHYAIIPGWLYESDASSGAIHLYGLLNYKYGGYKRGIFPSRATLQAGLNVSKNTLDKYIKSLKAAGGLTVIDRSHEGKTNFYILNSTLPKGE